MERTALQKALNEIIGVRENLQDIYDYLPRRDIVSLICECYAVEQNLRFLLDYDRVVASDRAWEAREEEMSKATNLKEMHDISAKYRGPLCYMKRYL